MSRRHPPAHRWSVGDACAVPSTHRVSDRGGGFHTVTRWYPGTIATVRGDQVVVRYYRWELEFPWWAVRPPAAHRGDAWQRRLRWGHDRHRRTITEPRARRRRRA